MAVKRPTLLDSNFLSSDFFFFVAGIGSIGRGLSLAFRFPLPSILQRPD